MVQPLVSCIMPTKNRRRFVDRSISMWMSQKGYALSPHEEPEHIDWQSNRIELIVLEDGDEDSLPLIRDCELDKIAQVRYERFEGTLGAKLNRGAQIARGKYLINWDDDDWQHPERIAKTVQLFELTGAKMLAMSSMLYYREGDEHGWQYEGNAAFYGSGAGQAFERQWVLDNPHLDITMGEDNDMVKKAKQQGVLATIAGTQMIVACLHGNNSTNFEMPGESLFEKQFGRIADNWTKFPLEKFSWVQQWAFDQVPA